MGTIISLCSGTGAWEKPFKDAGWKVIAVTLPENDVLTWKLPNEPIDGILAAPPCTQFSFARTKAKTPRDLREGMEVVEACLHLIWEAQSRTKSDQQKYPPLQFWALENPYWGMLRWFLGKPAFEFNPYDFGDRYQKHTALWGVFNEPKKHPIVLTGKEKYKFGRHSQALPKLPEGYIHGDLNNRAAARAITPRGFALAFYEANKERRGNSSQH